MSLISRYYRIEVYTWILIFKFKPRDMNGYLNILNSVSLMNFVKEGRVGERYALFELSCVSDKLPVTGWL